MCRNQPKPKRQRGIGLIGALFLIVTVAALSVTIASLVRTSGESYALDILNQKALRAAESGVHLGLNRTFAPNGAPSCGVWNWTFTEVGLERCNANVTCTPETAGGETMFNLVSAATCGVGGAIAQRSVMVGSVP